LGDREKGFKMKKRQSGGIRYRYRYSLIVIMIIIAVIGGVVSVAKI